MEKFEHSDNIVYLLVGSRHAFGLGMAGLQRAAAGAEDDVRGAPARRPAPAHRARPAVRGGAGAAAGLPHLQPGQEADR